MRFPTRRDGWNIDKDSGPAYEAHLDAIRGALPVELYEMLRHPAVAYQNGRTFYDAIAIEWRGSLTAHNDGVRALRVSGQRHRASLKRQRSRDV
jgi:hypothetical protein